MVMWPRAAKFCSTTEPTAVMGYSTPSMTKRPPSLDRAWQILVTNLVTVFCKSSGASMPNKIRILALSNHLRSLGSDTYNPCFKIFCHSFVLSYSIIFFLNYTNQNLPTKQRWHVEHRSKSVSRVPLGHQLQQFQILLLIDQELPE